MASSKSPSQMARTKWRASTLRRSPPPPARWSARTSALGRPHPHSLRSSCCSFCCCRCCCCGGGGISAGGVLSAAGGGAGAGGGSDNAAVLERLRLVRHRHRPAAAAAAAAAATTTTTTTIAAATAAAALSGLIHMLVNQKGREPPQALGVVLGAEPSAERLMAVKGRASLPRRGASRRAGTRSRNQGYAPACAAPSNDWRRWGASSRWSVAPSASHSCTMNGRTVVPQQSEKRSCSSTFLNSHSPCKFCPAETRSSGRCDRCVWGVGRA